jgi:hypothetical protein
MGATFGTRPAWAWRGWRAASVDAARQQTEQKLAIEFAAQHLSKDWWSLIVANYQVIADMGVDRDASVTKMTMYDARLVLLVVIDP